MKRTIKYDKLVRDNIPKIIERYGGKVNYIRLEDPDEFKTALKQKLIEEVNEFLHAKTDDEAIEELADILTVIETMNIMYGYRVKDRVRTKAQEKGLFNEKIFLESVEEEITDVGV